ncbi:hypothetical protein SUDANB146_00438 [Streptomyces sp. enrichment culture]
MGHRRCRGATTPWAAAGRGGRHARGHRTWRRRTALAPRHGPPRGPPPGAGPGATGRSAGSRHAGPGVSTSEDSFRTAGMRLRAVRKPAEQRTGPHLRSLAAHTPGTDEQTSTHPPVTSPVQQPRAGTPLTHDSALHMPRTRLRHDSSGPSALTVFTSGDEIATPRNRRGEPWGASPRRACIPAFHIQTWCCRREFTRPPHRGARPPSPPRPPPRSHGRPHHGFRPDRARAAPGPAGSSGHRHGHGVEADPAHAENRGHARSPTCVGATSRREQQSGAAPAHCGPTARHRSPASAHSATRRTTVSWWSDRKKCPPGSISSRKPAVV